jgi:hypothetical protein
VGAGNSSGHPEQAFRPTRSDPSLGDPSALSSLQPRRTSGSLSRDTPKQFDPSVHPSDDRERRRSPSHRTIRMDRAVPEFHRTMKARSGRAAGQRPRRVSAPTGPNTTRFTMPCDWPRPIATELERECLGHDQHLPVKTNPHTSAVNRTRAVPFDAPAPPPHDPASTPTRFIEPRTRFPHTEGGTAP